MHRPKTKTKKHRRRRCCDNLPGGRYNRQKSSAMTDSGCNKQCHDATMPRCNVSRTREARERAWSILFYSCVDGDISVDNGNEAGLRMAKGCQDPTIRLHVPLSGRRVTCRARRVHASCIGVRMLGCALLCSALLSLGAGHLFPIAIFVISIADIGFSAPSAPLDGLDR